MINKERWKWLTCLKWLALVVAIVLVVSGFTVAQSSMLTIHVYVDPIYGDDTAALAQNPVKATPPSGVGVLLQRHPNSTAAASGTHMGVLNQAPYSFRTVGAAISYINTFKPSGGNNALPWTNPNNGKEAIYAVIHCLPGLYGGVKGQVDPENGIPWNGETFPIDLPQRVSIQGVSALNVIFDAQKADTSIFRIGWPIPEDTQDFQYSFIDSVTIRNARGQKPSGAGVLIWKEHPVVHFTVSNCFIIKNQVGVAILQDDPELAHIHKPIIVNNTFFGNQVGIWNGHLVGAEYKGDNKPIVINNIFDSSTPIEDLYQQPAFWGVSCFEGMHRNDMTVSSPIGGDFNAYESATPIRYNLGDNSSIWPPNQPNPYLWPRTKARSGGNPGPPRVNIAPYTHPPANYTGTPGQVFSTSREVLYITDVFRLHPTLAPSNQKDKISRHDFRLAPTALTGGAHVVNPLINQGICFGLDSSYKPIHTGTITMLNGDKILYSPGLPPPGQPFEAQRAATINAWDWDCEGFGNMRIAYRRYGPARTDTRLVIDIGADECGEHVVSGYLNDTTIFSKSHSALGAGNLPPRPYLYYFNVSQNASSTAGTYLIPQYNFAADIVYTSPYTRPSGTEWFSQISSNPYAYGSGNNYTTGRFDNRTLNGQKPPYPNRNVRWYYTQDLIYSTPPANYNDFPFMRNLLCDIAPHLWNSGHKNSMSSLWGELVLDSFYLKPSGWSQAYPIYDDIFQSNPWYNQDTGPYWKFDNGNLYYYDGSASQPDRIIRIGMVAPPRVVPKPYAYNPYPSTYAWESYLSVRTYEYTGVFWYAFGYSTQYTVDPYGVAGDIAPYVSGSDWHGLRINQELLNPGDPYWVPSPPDKTWPGIPSDGRVPNNVQSFLVVLGESGATIDLSNNSNFVQENSLEPGSKAQFRALKAMQAILDARRKGK